MSATLVHRSGPSQGQKYNLTKTVTRLGRKSDNDIPLQDNVVSGYHAEIHSKENSYLIRDLESTNGLFVNGERVGEARLKNGDRIEVGENGPALEFKAGGETRAALPCIVPLSGAWEAGHQPIELSKAKMVLGRGSHNAIVVGKAHGSVVSGEHATIYVHSDSCELEDLASANGTFINDRRITRSQLHHGDRVELGEGGPVFRFEWEAESKKGRPHSKEEDLMYRKLERAAKGGPAGEGTMMLYQLANKFYKKRRRPYLIISSIVIVIALAALTGSYFLWRQLDRVNNLNKFYQSRSFELDLVGKTGLTDTEKKSLRAKRSSLEEEYEKYLVKVGWYANKTEPEKEVLRMARRLGEADLEVPQGFYQMVMEYVRQWKSTNKLRQDLDRARSRDLLRRIRGHLLEKDLPPEFLFIAMAESGFDPNRVGGKPTQYGWAKGLWQFIPPTATEYGLQLGPLKNEQKSDPFDQRQDEERSTLAAANYLRYLYTTKAAASGLLVIASYNFGQSRIISRLDSLPEGPRERNFWNFYRNNWLPPETKEYVFRIFSAALICEKPDVFGVDMPPITKEW